MRNYNFRHAGVLFPAAECLRCQFAPVAALRSALHSYRTFITRGLYLISRCGFDSDVLQVYPMRNYHFRHAGRRQTERAYTITIAGNKVFFRVQSERSAGVPPVSIRGACTPRVLPPGTRTGQFAPVAPLRSALHSYRTFVTRGLYFIDRQTAFCSPWL